MYQLFTNVDWSNNSEKISLNQWQSSSTIYRNILWILDAFLISVSGLGLDSVRATSTLWTFLDLILAMNFYLFSVKISVGLPTNPDAESRKFNTLLYLNYCVAKIEIQNLTNYKPIKWSVVLADNTLILGRMEEQCGHGCILHGVMGKLKWHLCAQVLLIFNSRLILDFFLFLNWAFLDWNPKNL